MAQALLAGEKRHATTLEIIQALQEEYGPNIRKKVLSKLFQALRIAVNNELGELQTALTKLEGSLASGGRAVVISYHSLEDRMVKRFFMEAEKECVCPSGQPVCTCSKQVSLKRINKKVIRPAESEIAANRRARSARLRCAERV